MIFGCWTSASRKSVKPVVEQNYHLLIYPMAYEGLEQSPNIVYTGAAPNQQVIPAVSWSLRAPQGPQVLPGRLGLRLAALRQRDHQGPAQGRWGPSGRRGVHPLRQHDVDGLRRRDQEGQARRDHQHGGRRQQRGVLSSWREPRASAPRACRCSSFSIAEDELRKLPVRAMVGDYAAWNYFQTSTGQENREFVRKFQARYGSDRVTSDVIVAAYNSVYLWAQAVEEAETDRDRRGAQGGPQAEPESAGRDHLGRRETQHTWRPVYIGRIRGDGQFDIVWNSEKPVRPVPFPTSRSRLEWESFLDELYRSWGGWANPGRASTSGPLPGGATAPAPSARLRSPGRADRRSPRRAARPGRPRREGRGRQRQGGGGRHAAAPHQPGRGRHPVPARPTGMPVRRDALR